MNVISQDSAREEPGTMTSGFARQETTEKRRRGRV